MSKKCTLLWHEASTFRSQNVQSTPTSDHFWKLRRRKSARCCGAKHISKSKCAKHTSSGPLLEVEMSKKCSVCRCGAKHISNSKCSKTQHARTTFEGSDVVLRGRRKKFVRLAKREQNVRILQHFQKRWQAWGHLQRTCKDAFRVAGAVQET